MKKTMVALSLCFILLISGCHASTNSNETENSEVTTDSEMFSARDFEVGYDESESIHIHLDGDGASCSSDSVKISDSHITITDEGTYLLSGTLDDGMIIVDAKKTDKIQLVLNGVTIHSESSAPIYILQADKVFITTTADATNTLSNGGTFNAIDENNIDAVIFSKEDLTLNGDGTLVITSPAGHGIVSKDSLKITSGVYDINCANHGLSGKDDVCIANAQLKIVSGKDGIHADDETLGLIYIQSGTFDISAQGDGLSASKNLTVMDGTFAITSGGGSINGTKKTSDSWGNFQGGGRHEMMKPEQMPSVEETDEDSTSMKGIKSVSDLVINGGHFTLDTADDGIHSNTSIIVNGGTFDIASGDDGFHADDTLTIHDGTIIISKSYEGLEGLHVDIAGGDITISATDDGINAAGGNDASGMTGGRDGMFGKQKMTSSEGTITISGGQIDVTAYGDGIDANGTVEMSGGYIVVTGPTTGDTSTLDYDISANITGGTFIGAGASCMAQTFSDSTQGVIAVSVGNQVAGTEIKIMDQSGNTILTHCPDLDYEVVIISSPDITKQETYTISVGTNSGEVTAK